MQPFSRETIVDRRQPAVRWSAVVAGAAVAISTWMLLQLFGSGVALSMLGTHDLDRVRGFSIGTNAWSVLAPLIALFLGGMLAARISGHHDRPIAGLHGLLVWAFAAFVGVALITTAIAAMSPPSVVMSPVRELTATSEELRLRAISTANTAGCAFLVGSLAIALGAIAAVGGALVVAYNSKTKRRHDTVPGHTTAPYPVPTEPID
jgi:hypothetical protein